MGGEEKAGFRFKTATQLFEIALYRISLTIMARVVVLVSVAGGRKGLSYLFALLGFSPLPYTPKPLIRRVSYPSQLLWCTNDK